MADVNETQTMMNAKLITYPTTIIVLISFYNILGVLFAFLGNGLVLVSSIKYRAIDMDKTSIILLQNLAVADFLIALLSWLPTTISTVVQAWVLGEVVCFLAGLVVYVPALVELLILTVISCHKVYTLVYPLHNRQRPVPRSTVVALVAVIWLIAICFLLLCIVMLGQYSVYHPETFSCTSSHKETNHNKANAISLAFLVVALPALVTIIIANLALLSIVSRHNSQKYRDIYSRQARGASESDKQEITLTAPPNSDCIASFSSPQSSKHSTSRENSSKSLTISRENSGKERQIFSRENSGKSEILKRSPSREQSKEILATREDSSSGVMTVRQNSGKRINSIQNIEQGITYSQKESNFKTSEENSAVFSPRMRTRIQTPKAIKITISRENLLASQELSRQMSRDNLIVQDDEMPGPSRLDSSNRLSPIQDYPNVIFPSSGSSLGVSPAIIRDLSRSREVLNKITKKLSTNNFNVTKKAILMVSGVSWLFIMSIMPLIVQNLMTTFHHTELPAWFTLFQSEIYYLNVACNPVIYTLHSTRFRTFVKSAIRFSLRSLRNVQVGESTSAVQDTDHVGTGS